MPRRTDEPPLTLDLGPLTRVPSAPPVPTIERLGISASDPRRRRPRTLPAYQLKVTLLQVKPPVWRRLVLPGQWHLGRVHDAVQIAMGWEDMHLHVFRSGEREIGRPDGDLMGDLEREQTARLADIVAGVGDRFDYWYDFGDDWIHRLVVEDVLPHAAAARCTGGRGACPPEDCGGPWRYAEMRHRVDDGTWHAGPPVPLDVDGADAYLRALS